MIGAFAWLTTGRLAAAALQAVTFGALAVLVGPSELGVVGSVVAALTVLQAVWDLGLSTYLVRTRAEAPDDGRVRSAVVLNRLTTGPLLASAAVAGWLVLVVLGGGSLAPVLPLAVWAAAERNAETVAGIAIADGRAPLATANLVVRRAVAAAGRSSGSPASTGPRPSCRRSARRSGRPGSVPAPRRCSPRRAVPRGPPGRAEPGGPPGAGGGSPR